MDLDNAVSKRSVGNRWLRTENLPLLAKIYPITELIRPSLVIYITEMFLS